MALFEKFCFSVYKSIPPCALEFCIPFIDLIRKIKNKPKIPLNEKMAKIEYPDFKNQKVILLHGVSVGEIVSLENLIKKIKEIFKDYKIVITTGTLTGQELAKKKYCALADFITYFPLDIYKTADKFLNSINPSVVLIAETELWPNFSFCCKEKNIPLFIINGRISDKSYPSYKFFKGFFKIMLNCFSGIFCQSELDKKRFLSLGANIDNVKVMKNLKFEITKKECDINLSQSDFKVFIAASTHSGEDEIALFAFKKLKEKIKNLKLIIAPRHLIRVDDVKNLCEKSGFKFGTKSTGATFLDNDIIILDTLGELSKIYAIVDVAFIGGSFNKTGGHNPLEAAIFSKPTVSGPSIKNFRDIYSILQRENAAFVVENKKEFYGVLEKLFENKDYYMQISQNCANCFKNQQGALDFVIEELRKILLSV